MGRISEIHTANLIANEERGAEATGIALLFEDGHYEVNKAALPAHAYVASGCFCRVMGCLDSSVTVLLGHTRDPAKGSPELPSNNHPIIRGDTIGIHNGSIKNDDELFSNLNDTRTSGRIGSVDSEAIFAHIDCMPRGHGLGDYARRLHDLSMLLVGSYTILYFHPNEPYRLYLLKYNNPVSVHYEPELNSLFFSSRYVFLRKAFGRSVITEALPSKMGYVFDARLIKAKGKLPLLAFPLAEQMQIC